MEGGEGQRRAVKEEKGERPTHTRKRGQEERALTDNPHDPAVRPHHPLDHLATLTESMARGMGGGQAGVQGGTSRTHTKRENLCLLARHDDAGAGGREEARLKTSKGSTTLPCPNVVLHTLQTPPCVHVRQGQSLERPKPLVRGHDRTAFCLFSSMPSITSSLDHNQSLPRAARPLSYL